MHTYYTVDGINQEATYSFQSKELATHKMQSMSRDESTTIASDGLRYKSKEAESPFGGSSSMAAMSCYKCGLHKPRALGVFKKLAGQNMFCCGECTVTK